MDSLIEGNNHYDHVQNGFVERRNQSTGGLGWVMGIFMQQEFEAQHRHVDQVSDGSISDRAPTLSYRSQHIKRTPTISTIS